MTRSYQENKGIGSECERLGRGVAVWLMREAGEVGDPSFAWRTAPLRTTTPCNLPKNLLLRNPNKEHPIPSTLASKRSIPQTYLKLTGELTPMTQSTAPILSGIEHIVVLMLENRSFDNILGWLYDDKNAPPFNQVPSGQTFDGVSGKNLTNPWDKSGPQIVVQVPVGATTDPTNPYPDPGEVYANVYQQLYNASPRPRPTPVPPNPPQPPPMSGFVNNYAAQKGSTPPDIMNGFVRRCCPISANSPTSSLPATAGSPRCLRRLLPTDLSSTPAPPRDMSTTSLACCQSSSTTPRPSTTYWNRKIKVGGFTTAVIGFSAWRSGTGPDRALYVRFRPAPHVSLRAISR